MQCEPKSCPFLTCIWSGIGITHWMWENDFSRWNNINMEKRNFNINGFWSWWTWRKANCKFDKPLNWPKHIKNIFWKGGTMRFQGDFIMVYDGHHDRNIFKILPSKWFGPSILFKVFFDNNTGIGSPLWKGIW